MEGILQALRFWWYFLIWTNCSLLCNCHCGISFHYTLKLDPLLLNFYTFFFLGFRVCVCVCCLSIVLGSFFQKCIFNINYLIITWLKMSLFHTHPWLIVLDSKVYLLRALQGSNFFFLGSRFNKKFYTTLILILLHKVYF